ncbi:MAG: hypothetical protein AAF399_21525, partial [Bacteroidota bacterium]
FALFQSDWGDFASVLPPELLGGSSPFWDNVVITNTGGTVVQTGTGTAISGSDVSLGTSGANAGDQLSLAAFDLPSDDTLLITFDATVIPNATAGGSFDVTASADYNSLLADDARGRDNSTGPGSVDDDNDADLNNYEESGSVTTNLTATLAIVKALNAFHVDNDFTVGDSILYDIKVAVPEGTITSLVVTDSLVDGLGFISARFNNPGNIAASLSDDGVVNASGKVTFTIGTVTNTADGNPANDTLVIILKTQVLDDATNIQAGMSKDNEAKATSSLNGSPITSNTVSIDIVEPSLTISVTPSSATPSLGEVVTFSVQVQNTGGATAHDLDLASVLRELYLTYESFNAGASGFSINDTDPDSLVFSLASLAAGGDVTFTFEAKVDSGATLDSTLNLTVGLSDGYDTQPGDPSTPWTQRTYDLSASTAVTPTLKVVDAQKTVVNADDVTANGTVDPGETLAYTIVLTNNTGGTLTNVAFADLIPTQTTYVAASLSSTQGTVDASGAPNLSVDVGSMLAAASVTITFDVTVDGGTPDGTVVSNQGVVSSDQTEPEPTDVDGIDANGDQPTDIMVGTRPVINGDLYAQKVVSWLTDTDADDAVTASDIMRYTFILENQGPVQLTNVSLTDAIPSGLSFSAAGTPSEGSLATGSFPNISWTGITLEVGEIATVTLDVSIDAFGGATETFTNQATVNSDQTGEGDTDSNGDPIDGWQETEFSAVNGGSAAPELDLEKRWTQTLDADGDGLIDPGDRYRYTITLVNTGSAAATDISLTDAAPSNTTLAGDSVLTSQGIIETETSASVEINLGSLNPGGVAIVSMEVVVDGGTADGTLIPNQAAAITPDFNSSSAFNSDNNGDDSDGIQPTQTPVYTGSGTLDASDLTKTLTRTSEGGSAGTNVLIGEVVEYQVGFVVPRGQLDEVTMIDTLPRGLAYLANSASLNRVFGTGLTAAENPGNINAAASGIDVSLTDGTDLTVVGDTAIRLLLGDVINSDAETGPVTDEVYTLSLAAVVLNESGIGNDAGQTLTNRGSLSYVDGINQVQGLQVSSNPTVTIQEPNVGISQNGSSTWILTEGGMIEYTVVLSNPSGANVSTAYDLVFTDSLPFDANEFEVLSVESTNGSASAGSITDNSDLPNGRLNIGVDSLPAGETVTIVFRASADGVPELTTAANALDNTAYVTASSLPGTQGSNSETPGSPGDADGERTSGGTHPDSDYLASDDHAVEVLQLTIHGNKWHHTARVDHSLALDRME